MGSEKAIACSLSAGDYRERLEQIHEIGREALIAADDRGGTVRLVFAEDAGIRARLEDIVAAEAACCPFLDLELGEAPEGIALTIGAPPEAAPIVADLVRSFTG
jgi:hypothetical protein